MYESTYNMIQVLSAEEGIMIPESKHFDRTSSQSKPGVWSYGLGADVLATLISMAALMLIAFLA